MFECVSGWPHRRGMDAWLVCVCGNTADVAQPAYINHMVAARANEDGVCVSVQVCVCVCNPEVSFKLWAFLQV